MRIRWIAQRLFWRLYWSDHPYVVRRFVALSPAVYRLGYDDFMTVLRIFPFEVQWHVRSEP